MKNIYTILLFLVCFSSVEAKPIIQCDANKCINTETRSLSGVTFTPSFKTIYDTKLLRYDQSCNEDPLVLGNTLMLPALSKFRQTLDNEVQSDKEIIVHVYEVKKRDGLNPNITNITDPDYQKLFSRPHKICISGKHAIPRSNYKRIGGVNTGLLVVPFKIRDKDLYSDSTIGPYISYKFQVIELLATAGISQISVSEVGTDKVESETGLTYAFGINFEILKNWDVAFIVGADHLSGEKGDNWEFQDEAWASFAIGYNFTR